MEIFRKSALDKLSSPEQLDKMIVVTSPMTWLVAIGGAVIVSAALIWSIFGRLPQNVESNGIILSGEGTGITYSEVSGIIDEVYVSPGEHIEKGQVIASIDAGNITEEITVLSNRIASVEAITLDSEGDVSTSDNKTLLDIKAELIPLQDVLNKAQRELDTAKREISVQQATVNRCEADMNEKKANFYNSINDRSGARQQADYSENQSELASAQSYADGAKSSIASAQASLEQAYIQKDRAEDLMKKASDSSNARKKEYDTTLENITNISEQILVETDPVKKQQLEEALVAEQGKSQEALANYQSAYANYESYRSNYQSAEDNAKMAEASLEAANDVYSGYAGRLSYNMQRAADSKEKYINYQDAAAVVNKINNIASNEYSFASNMYVTEKNTLESLKQNAISLEAEVISAKEQVDSKKEVLTKNFEASKDGIISGLNLELSKLTRNLTKTEIVSTQTGEVKEVVISNGTALQSGAEVLKVLKGQADTKEAVCYAPVTLGKKIRPGMEVMIYPTTTNKQEHGHMVGTVKSVAVYVTSQAELMKRLGDDTLAQTFLKNGPVVEVVCEIKPDAETNSGFYWSSKKGKEVNIDEGTIFNANVVVEKKAPITMVIPILKDKFTIKPIQK